MGERARDACPDLTRSRRQIPDLTWFEAHTDFLSVMAAAATTDLKRTWRRLNHAIRHYAFHQGD